MTFLKLFLIHMFKNQNLAEIFTNLAENENNLKYEEFMEFDFSKSGLHGTMRINVSQYSRAGLCISTWERIFPKCSP